MDNVNNNFNKTNINFSGINKDKPQKMLSREERMNLLMSQVRTILLEDAERQVPENGQFRRVNTLFDIPETSNEGILSIEHDELEPKTQRRLKMSVRHENSDRLVSNYILKGTKKEILDYLKDDNNLAKLIEIANELSDKTDVFYL